MSQASKTVIMLGDINVDNIWPVPAIPQPGRDGLVDTVKMETGGAILNSAILMDRLGFEPSLIGCVGDDVWYAYLKGRLSNTRIDLSALQRTRDQNTGLTFILVTPDGERTMLGYRGANKLLSPEAITSDLFESASWLHISGYAFLESPQREAAWRAIELATDRSVPISLDTGLEPVMRHKADFLRVLPLLELCISGLAEMDQLLGAGTPEEAAEKLLAAGVGMAAIKLGGEGSLLLDEKESFHCPPFEVDVVDTTGAGDAYSAGLLYGRLHGFDLRSSGVLASALGALAACSEGAGLALPNINDLTAFLTDRRLTDNNAFREVLFKLHAHFQLQGD